MLGWLCFDENGGVSQERLLEVLDWHGLGVRSAEEVVRPLCQLAKEQKRLTTLLGRVSRLSDSLCELSRDSGSVQPPLVPEEGLRLVVSGFTLGLSYIIAPESVSFLRDGLSKAISNDEWRNLLAEAFTVVRSPDFGGGFTVGVSDDRLFIEYNIEGEYPRRAANVAFMARDLAHCEIPEILSFVEYVCLRHKGAALPVTLPGFRLEGFEEDWIRFRTLVKGMMEHRDRAS